MQNGHHIVAARNGWALLVLCPETLISVELAPRAQWEIELKPFLQSLAEIAWDLGEKKKSIWKVELAFHLSLSLF